MATIYEVSKLAGVSLATVSRVMNKSASVSEKTRAKVHEAMRLLDYRPNAVAKSLASSRSDCVGVLVSELHGPFYGAMMGGIEGVLREADKHIVVTASHNEEKREKDDIEFLINRNCDALILHVEAVSDAYLINLCQGKTPVVILNRLIPEIEEHCISLDNELGGYLSTRSVLEKGHRELVYITGPIWKADAQDRLAGHKRALAEWDIPFDETRVFEGDYLQTGGHRAITHFINSGLKFTAVICANDEIATGVMSTARELGKQVPEDFSVIGYDNVIFSSYTYPKLTTIDYPVRDMGVMAAQSVLKTVYKKTTEDIRRVFEPTLIERDSVVTLSQE